LKKYTFIFLSMLVFLFVACGLLPEANATQASIATSSAATAIASAPKPGQWKGEYLGGVYDGTVSFDIGTDGNIHDFRFSMNFLDDGCIITSDRIVVKADGTFSFKFGDAVGEDTNIIRGKFDSSTTLVGSTSNNIECVGQSGYLLSSTTLFSATEDSWHAEIADGRATTVPTATSVGQDIGEVLTLAIDPASPNILYAAVDGRGIFKSINAGMSWDSANDGLTYNSVFALAIDPSSTTTIYAGTWFGGVFKSTDGGKNWTPTGLIQTNIYDLAIDSGTPTTIYAATSGKGVFKSTDGGERWSAVNAGLTDDIVDAFSITSRLPTTLYAGTGDGGFFKSTDGGEKWSILNADLNESMTTLAIDPVTVSTLYFGSLSDGMFKSTDEGQNWTAINTGLTDKTVFIVAIDPVMPTILYAGTLNMGVFKSTDGGRSWSATNMDPYTYVHAIAIDPVTPTTLYAGTWDGIFKSTDSGESWSAINTGLNMNGT
jgi:photosystem II stability/assembly factor-like uncharacterized protein